MDSCIAEERMDSIVGGAAPTPVEAAHIAACVNCRNLAKEYRTGADFMRTVLEPGYQALEEIEAQPLAFGPYRVSMLIGRGGMSSVYEAVSPDGATVAVKVCHRKEALPWFKREIEAMRKVIGEGIPPLIDADKDHYPAYLVTRYYSGGNLAEKLKSGPLDIIEVKKLALRMAEILQLLEKAGVVHRDLKPSNILFDGSGEAWLADFGLARHYLTKDDASEDVRLQTLCGTLTRPDSPPLTVSYMSPEQAANETLTPASDVFSLGITLFESLFGCNPFQGKTIYDTAHRIMSAEPVHPGKSLAQVPSDLYNLVLRCLARRPEDRPTCQEIMIACKKSALSRQDKANPTAVCGGNTQEGEKKMNVAVQGIRRGTDFLRANGLPVSDRLASGLENIENPRFKVGFVGQYQVGKSTLINKVFLKDDVLLKEGIGLCTTAVATEVTYGVEKRLEVFPWSKTTQPVSMTVGGNTQGETVQVVTGVGSPRVTVNPSADDIARATTSSVSDERTRLAQDTAAVRLNWPVESLKRYTLLDTPGINDPNTILLDNTTYRILPEMDVAILVVEARQLGEVDLEFLRGRMLDQGMSRVMVLVSYKPQANPMAEPIRNDILVTIKAQLAEIGREYIPVRMYCFDPAVSGVLNTPEAIEREILAFLEANVLPGRIERVAFDLHRNLQAALMQVSTELAFAGKSAAEREQLLAKIKQQEAVLRTKYQDITDGILGDLLRLKRHFVSQVNGQMTLIGEKYIDGFSACSSFADAKERLERAELLMKPNVEKMVFDLADAMKKDLGQVMQQHGKKFRSAVAEWNAAISITLNVDGGALAKLTPSMVTLGDLLLTIVLIPGGPVVNLIERWVAGKIPFLKNFLPSKIAMDLMVNAVKSSVRSEVGRIAQGIAVEMENAFAAMELDVVAKFEEAYAADASIVVETAEKTLPGKVSSERVVDLSRVKDGVERELGAMCAKA